MGTLDPIAEQHLDNQLYMSQADIEPGNEED